MSGLSPAELAQHDLEQILPAMQGGCVIHTRRGSITLDAGELRRERDLVHAVESILKYRLFLAERGGAA